ncbi:hypothetical protein HON52_00500 [Candidatus Uhrbacteria bacterium]|jgi:O-antigen ligase|nr:hypothetical protein [Candidatus Uhrbacteria bacterium]
MIYLAFVSVLLFAFAALAWRDLRMALIVLAGLLPIYLLRFSYGPVPSTVLEGFILIALLIWIIQKKKWPFNPIPLFPWIMPGLLLLAAACFGVVVAPDVFGALGVWKAYFVEPLIVFVLFITVLKKKDWALVIKALTVTTLVLSAAAILQWLTGLGIPTPWDIELRTTGLFEYPNALGLFLVPIITLLIVRAFNAKRRNWLEITAIIAGIIAIYLSKTEAAYVAIPAALLVIFMMSSARKTLKLRVAGEAVLILIVLLAFVPAASKKLLLRDESGLVRQSQWSETTQMLLDNPAFGAGLNAYPEALEPYHDSTLYEIFQYPHTLIFNIWTELGLLGIFAFAWLAWFVMEAAWKNRKNPEVVAIFAALLAMTIHGLVDVPYFKNDLSVLTWILIAGIVLQTQKNSENKKPAKRKAQS